MLYISKWKAAAILLTALICCLFAVPNFFPESMVKRWPAWAQRHIVLGLDLQGGSHILLEVDVNDVRRQKLLALQDDVRRVLREARVGLTRAPLIRGNSVEVVIRESDLQQGLTKLRELSQPLEILGKTAKLTFRLVDTSMPVEQALQGRPPPESEIVYGTEAERSQPYLLEKRVIVSGEELTDAQPGFDQRSSEPIVTFKFNTSGARKFAQVTQEN